MTIGNIKNWRRNKPDAKQLLGYLPILKSSNSSENQSESFKNGLERSASGARDVAAR